MVITETGKQQGAEGVKQTSTDRMIAKNIWM